MAAGFAGFAGWPAGASGCDVNGEGGAEAGEPTGGAVGTAAGTPILSSTDFGAVLRDDISCNTKARPKKIPPHDQLALVNRLPACRVPIFFVNGTNDFAYPLDSYMKSYALVPGPRNIRITVNMPHGHSQG